MERNIFCENYSRSYYPDFLNRNIEWAKFMFNDLKCGGFFRADLPLLLPEAEVKETAERLAKAKSSGVVVITIDVKKREGLHFYTFTFRCMSPEEANANANTSENGWGYVSGK